MYSQFGVHSINAFHLGWVRLLFVIQGISGCSGGSHKGNNWVFQNGRQPDEKVPEK